MARQGEGRLQYRIRKALQAKYGGWWFKVWGGPFQQAGVPDLVGCVEGMFFALEVKVPKRRNNVSDIQRATIRAIKGARGTAGVVTSVDEAIEIVGKALRKVGRLPTKRRVLESQKKQRWSVFRAGHRKDVDRRRRA